MLAETVGRYHRGRTYIESDRMTSSAPMESADQTARPGVVSVQPWLYLYWHDPPPNGRYRYSSRDGTGFLVFSELD